MEQGGPSPPDLRGELQVLRAPLHGFVPDLVAVLVEDQLGVGWRREPQALRQLALELARSPAGIAEGDQTLHRPAVVGDVAQNLAARRHGHVAVEVEGAAGAVIAAVEDKSEFRLHWSAHEDAY